MGGHRQQVGAEVVEGDRVVARPRRASTCTSTALAARGDHLGDRLQRADLVVGPLQVHERSVVADGVEQLVGVDAPGAVDADDGDLAVRLGAEAHGRVLDGARHLVGPGSAAPQHAVAIASVAPAGEHDLAAGHRTGGDLLAAVSTATRASCPSAWIRPGSPSRRAGQHGGRRSGGGQTASGEGAGKGRRWGVIGVVRWSPDAAGRMGRVDGR